MSDAKFKKRWVVGVVKLLQLKYKAGCSSENQIADCMSRMVAAHKKIQK
jgi:hypothetical protein